MNRPRNAGSTANPAATATSAPPAGVKELILQKVGFLPKDAFGWLYACRGLYQTKDYAYVVEGLSHCLRNEHTAQEALHLLAFSLLRTHQIKPAAAAFYKSIQAGNEGDWQPLVELCIENPGLQFQQSSSASTSSATAAPSSSSSSALSLAPPTSSSSLPPRR